MNSQFATTLARALPSASRAGLSTASPLRLARPFSSSSVWKAPDNPKQKTRRAEYQIFNATGSEGASPAAHLNKLMGEGKNDTPLSNPLSYGSMASSLESELLPHPYSDRQPPHHLHVYSHKHNTILTLTRPNGDPLLVRSCGHLGFRKSQRSGYDPAYQLAVHMFGQMQEKGLILDIQRLELVFRDFGPGREAFTKVLLGNEGRNIRGLVSRVTDATRIKFGGTRSRKVRRLVLSGAAIIGVRVVTPFRSTWALVDWLVFGFVEASVYEQRNHCFFDLRDERLDECWRSSPGPSSKTVWMHPLNPFLRAFFRSTVPGQCLPIENHVLLVPTTESLIGSRDRESNLYYSDIVGSEDFLGSHVLRVSFTLGHSGGKDDLSIRDSRGKAKQVTTVNGRTVIVKENSVYSNKGFKSFSQAQLLSDVLYYTPSNESQPWLIYYISRPLIGSYEPAKIIPAAVPGTLPVVNKSNAGEKETSRSSGPASSPPKKVIRTFGELLVNFPMIARQMHPGLERLFREFGKELGKPLPPPPSRSPIFLDDGDSERPRGRAEVKSDETSSMRSLSTREHGPLPFNSGEFFEDDEDLMRRSLETAVTAAIDLFRLVDKQQLSLLGATTDLTGPLVEQLIERYVAEQVHGPLLFPRLCNFRKSEDAELDVRIRQMESIDVSQVGITVGGHEGKRELLQRLGRGVEEFRKILDAKCPQDMLDTLLETVKVISFPGNYDKAGGASNSEKQEAPVMVNADVLVSLLLVVVVRSQIRHLQARLLYMQHFIYIDDVDSGEMGYVLSTFEAVLTYLLTDSAGLRRASARNKRLWNATKAGRISDIKAVLEPDGDHESFDDDIPMEREGKSVLFKTEDDNNDDDTAQETSSLHSMPVDDAYLSDEPSSSHIEESSPSSETPPPLSHVFPFQTWASESHQKEPRRPVKKVSMDIRSMSDSSAVSLVSRTNTLGSMNSTIEGDSSIETLTKTQDPAGDSIPMMAVESCQPEALKYLLSLDKYYPLEDILADTNTEGTTLLNAAVQLGHTELVTILLDFLFNATDEETIVAYLRKADVHGRTVAHYLFSTPTVISRLGRLLPWKQRDKHGQTPLFALCRSYDHPHYKSMIGDALVAAQNAQGDGEPLHLDDHIDSKNNTLLHIVSDPEVTLRILETSDCDPNATNDKKFTPLMTASKYGRIDQVRLFFMDPRVDVHLKELRGLTAVEIAKDDEVRNRIDDLILLSNAPIEAENPAGRVTTVVRSFFVEDATVRFVLKSGAPNMPLDALEANPGSGTYTVTTCRRSYSDFENLAKGLSLEHPASYMPSLSHFRNPFQVHSKPSRAVLHDIQEKLDRFLKILLSHPTFETHEMLWEFFLVPDLHPEMMADRSRQKALALTETIAEDYAPTTVEGMRETEQFVLHAQEAVRAVHANSRSLIRRGHALHNATSDLADAVSMCSSAIATLKQPTNALPPSHVDAFARYASHLSTTSSDSSPLLQYISTLSSVDNTTAAVLTALSRPITLMGLLSSTTRTLSRSRSSLLSSSLPRKFNINFPGLEESRQKSARDLEAKIVDQEARSAQLARELTWNKDVVVGELAGWTSWRERVGRDAIRAFARDTLVREKERGKRIERCLQALRSVDLSSSSPSPSSSSSSS